MRGIDKDSIKLFVFEYFVFVVFMLGICIGVGINMVIVILEKYIVKMIYIFY